MIIKGYSNHCDKDFFKFLVEFQSEHRDQARKSFLSNLEIIFYSDICDKFVFS